MNSLKKISEAEMKVMNVLWNIGEMATISQIVTVLKEEGINWTRQTTTNFLKRLEVKGMVSSSKNGKNLYYYALMNKEQFKAKEANGFIKSIFEGSIKGFLSSFYDSKEISDEDIKELKEWFDNIDNK